MSQYVSNLTRGRGTTNTNLLDLILSNEEDNIREIKYLSPLGKSAHCVITFNIATLLLTNILKKILIRQNYEGMRKEFTNKDWEEKFTDREDNVNNQWEILKTVDTYLKKKFQFTEREISP